MGAVECQLEDESQQNITKLDVDSSLAMMKDMQASWQALRDQQTYVFISYQKGLIIIFQFLTGDLKINLLC